MQVNVLQEFLAEEEPAVEEESYPEPTAAVDDVLEQVDLLLFYFLELVDQLWFSRACSL